MVARRENVVVWGGLEKTDRLLSRAGALTNQRQYDVARALRDADTNPAVFIDGDALKQRFDTLRQRKHRETQAQQVAPEASSALRFRLRPAPALFSAVIP